MSAIHCSDRNFRADLGATVEEKSDHLTAVQNASEPKRGVAATIFVINVSATVEKPNNIKAVAAASVVKGSIFTRNGGRHTRIEVQPTSTHFTVSCRVAKAREVDIPTLLTQRGGSERGRRHRKPHDTSSFEPADVVVVCQLSPADLQAHRPNIHLGQRILQQCLESGQSPALGLHLHRHFLDAPRCRDLHRDARVYFPVVKEGEEGVLNNSRAHERNGKERGKMRVAKRLYSQYDSDYCLLILRRFALMTCPRSDRSSQTS